MSAVYAQVWHVHDGGIHVVDINVGRVANRDDANVGPAVWVDVDGRRVIGWRPVGLTGAVGCRIAPDYCLQGPEN